MGKSGRMKTRKENAFHTSNSHIYLFYISQCVMDKCIHFHFTHMEKYLSSPFTQYESCSVLTVIQYVCNCSGQVTCWFQRQYVCNWYDQQGEM